jgi:hypothetical protein
MTGTLTDNDIAVICGVIFFMVCFYFFYQKLNVTQEDIDKSRKSLEK